MKTTNRFLILAVALVMFGACSKEKGTDQITKKVATPQMTQIKKSVPGEYYSDDTYLPGTFDCLDKPDCTCFTWNFDDEAPVSGVLNAENVITLGESPIVTHHSGLPNSYRNYVNTGDPNYTVRLNSVVQDVQGIRYALRTAQ